MYHVFDILEEHGNLYLVQWTGYVKSEATWELKGKVNKHCTGAVRESKRLKKTDVSDSLCVEFD